MITQVRTRVVAAGTVKTSLFGYVCKELEEFRGLKHKLN